MARRHVFTNEQNRPKSEVTPHETDVFLRRNRLLDEKAGRNVRLFRSCVVVGGLKAFRFTQVLNPRVFRKMFLLQPEMFLLPAENAQNPRFCSQIQRT